MEFDTYFDTCVIFDRNSSSKAMLVTIVPGGAKIGLVEHDQLVGFGGLVEDDQLGAPPPWARG